MTDETVARGTGRKQGPPLEGKRYGARRQIELLMRNSRKFFALCDIACLAEDPIECITVQPVGQMPCHPGSPAPGSPAAAPLTNQGLSSSSNKDHQSLELQSRGGSSHRCPQEAITPEFTRYLHRNREPNAPNGLQSDMLLPQPGL